MKRKICYLISGPSYLPYLTTSLHTLRQHWQGEVEVHAWEESYDLVLRMSRDSSLDFQPVMRDPGTEGRRKKWQFLDKLRVVQSAEADSVLYLDADTTIHAPIDRFFTEAESTGFIATQFSDWTARRRTIQGRVKRLLPFPEVIPTEEIEKYMESNLPSPNGGVFACRPGSKVLNDWEFRTKQVMSIFIPDETVLHWLVWKYLGNGLSVFTGRGRYNCSPKYQSKMLDDKDIVVSHYHGHCNTRWNKSPKAVRRWWPIYTECLEKNVGGMAEWIGSVENKYLTKIIKEKRL